MRWLAQRVAGGIRRLGRQIFEKEWQEIRQFVRAHRHAAFFVQRLQIDHRLAAIAAFAVHMLEKMQRERAGAVETAARSAPADRRGRRRRFPSSSASELLRIGCGHLARVDRLADLAGRPAATRRSDKTSNADSTLKVCSSHDLHRGLGAFWASRTGWFRSRRPNSHCRTRSRMSRAGRRRLRWLRGARSG